MSLSSLIVQRELASIRQVEEALARQVLYGGDLVTNLLEVVQLPESVLVPLLAESVGIPAAPIGLLPAPSPQARALVPEDVAARRLVVPLSIEGEKLVLAVSEPLGQDVKDELSFALSVSIEERVAPSVRIREALARVYGVPLDRRMARLVGRLAGVDPTVPNSLPPLRGPKATIPPLPGALSHDLPKLNPPGMPAIGTMRFPDAAPPRASHPAPVEAAVPPAPVAAPLPIERPPPPARKLSVGAPRLLREVGGGPRPAGEARRRGPITLDRVSDELSTISDREGLLGLYFDFARQFFEYTAIFIVHGDVAEGRDAFGSGASRDRVVALGVPLELPSVFATVRDRGVPMCLYPSDSGIDVVLMGDLRRDVKSQVFVAPIVVRTRVVALIIADDGKAGIDASAQGQVTTVAALVGREFERLIVRMKLQGFSGEARTDAPRVDSRRVESKLRRRDPVAREAAVQALRGIVEPPPEPPAEGLVVSVAATETRDVSAAAPDASPADSPAPADITLASASSILGAIALEKRAVPLEAPTVELAAVNPSARPGALRPDALPAPATPMPRSYSTLRNFLSPVPPRVTADELDAEADDLEGPRYGALSDDPASEFLRDLSDRPPPPQTVAVRHPTGRPIPREDEGDAVPGSTRWAPERISSRPPPADLRQARLLREIDVLTAQFVQTEAPVSARGTIRGQTITIPPHRPPPSSRAHQPLPSVIVDVTAQTDQLVLAFIANPRDEQAEAELLRLGQQAMPSIMKHFPGPLTIARETLDDTWPRVTECGPVLRLIAGQRRVALPFVLGRTEDESPEPRFWATYLLSELAYPEAIPAVVARLFDDSKRIRRAARLVAHVLGDTSAELLVGELDRIVRDVTATSARRVVTLDAIGEMRDPRVVPNLLGALADEDEDVALAARRALMLVTRQDFGRDVRKWLAWWDGSASRHRVEWLIDALTHDVPAIRRAAGQELKALSEEYFGYYDDLPKRDRDRAQQRYRDWWKTEGQARFRKA